MISVLAVICLSSFAGSRANSAERPLISGPKLERGDAWNIPKIIHQTWNSMASLPPSCHEVIKENIQTNPGWIHKFYEEADRRNVMEALERVTTEEPRSGSDMGCFDGAVRAYDMVLPAGKADLFRLAILYLEGGVYLDMKTVATNLDGFVTAAGPNRILFPVWPGAASWQTMSSFMMWPRHHWIMAELVQTAIQRVLSYHRATHTTPMDRFYFVLWSAGPAMIYEVVNKSIETAPRDEAVALLKSKDCWCPQGVVFPSLEVNYTNSMIRFDGTGGRYYNETHANRWQSNVIYDKPDEPRWLWVAVLSDNKSAEQCAPTKVDIALRERQLSEIQDRAFHGQLYEILRVVGVLILAGVGTYAVSFLIRRRARMQGSSLSNEGGYCYTEGHTTHDQELHQLKHQLKSSSSSSSLQSLAGSPC